MKKMALFGILALALVMGLGGCNKTEQAGPRVAVVDAGKVFQESAPGKAGVAYLEKISMSAQEEFKAIQTEAEKDNSQESMMKMQRVLGDIQQRMNSEQQLVIGKLNDTFRKVLDAYLAERKLDVILPSDQVMSFGPSADVTNDIIAAMNKETVVYESEDAAPAAPEAAPAAEEAPAKKDEAAKPAPEAPAAPAAGEKKE